MSDETNRHGTCVDIGGTGVLLTGRSGSGKSDLALRLIERPFRSCGQIRLVADDQVLIARSGDALRASAPAQLQGRLEVRGVGIMEIETIAGTDLKLIVDLEAASAIERLPDHGNARVPLLGLQLPVLKLNPFELSAPEKLVLAVAGLHALFST
ncbi:MAG: hypothetical protein AAF441_17270 [Pseudomonadota bacterium]